MNTLKKNKKGEMGNTGGVRGGGREGIEGNFKEKQSLLYKCTNYSRWLFTVLETWTNEIKFKERLQF